MKYIKIISLVFIVVLLSGCGEQKEFTKTCTLTSNNPVDGYKLDTEYKIYGKGKIAEKVVTIETVTSDNDEILDYFEKTLKSTYETTNKEYGGYTNKVTNKDGKLVSETTIDYTKMDLEKYVKDNSVMKNYVNSKNELLADGVQKIYEALGATCK